MDMKYTHSTARTDRAESAVYSRPRGVQLWIIQTNFNKFPNLLELACSNQDYFHNKESRIFYSWGYTVGQYLPRFKLSRDLIKLRIKVAEVQF